jgi:hypothetical protein
MKNGYLFIAGYMNITNPHRPTPHRGLGSIPNRRWDIHMCICMYEYVCVYMCMYVNMYYVYMKYLRVYTDMHMHMFIYIHIYINKNMYIYIYISYLRSYMDI